MTKYLQPFRLKIHGGFYIFLAIALLIIPLPWLAAWLLSAIIHECGHLLALFSSGHHVARMDIGWNGAKIHTDMLGRDEWFCALAGPLLGLVFVSLHCVFPRLAICAAVQTAVNIIPILPLDGGRVLKGLLSYAMYDEKAAVVTDAIGMMLALVLLFFLGRATGTISVAFYILCVLFVCLKILQIKIPCKPGGKWIQ